MKRQMILNALLACSLLACGGAGTDTGNSVAGIGGTGAPANSAKTSGSITGFGSIFVNGIEFDTSGSTITIDGSAGSEADLKLGMVVNVSGDFDEATGSGTALTVEFNDSVQGPVTAIVTNPGVTEKSLSVLGVTVIAADGFTVFDQVSFATLAVNDLLEISGFYDANGVLRATRIEKKSLFTSGVSQVEIKGAISSVDTAAVTFVLGGYTVDYSGADVSELPSSGPATGMLVEVKGTLTGTTIVASEVEQEDDFLNGDVDSVSIEGLITELNVAGADTFKVSGQLVDVSAASFVPSSLQTTLANNITVEVKGSLSGGVLQASTVVARSSKLEIRAPVLGVSGQTITLTLGGGQSVAFTVDTQTRFNDQTGSAVLTLGGVHAGDYLVVRLVDTGSSYLATEVTRDDPDHEVIRGPVDSFVSGSHITLLGVTFSIDGDTEYEDSNDQDIPLGSDFFSMLQVGDVLKIEDERPGDGVADEVEFE